MDRKFTDKEIEKLFKAGLNNPEITYREDAWASMELLLNKKKRKKRRVFFWLFMGIMLLSTMIVGGYSLFQGSELEEGKITEDIIEKNNNPVQTSEQVPELHTQNEVQSEVLTNKVNNLTVTYDVSMSIQEDQNDGGNSNLLKGPTDDSETEDEKDNDKMSSESRNVLIPDSEDRNVSSIDDRQIIVSALQKRSLGFIELGFEHINSSDKIIIEKENKSAKWMFTFYGGPEWSSTPSSTYGNMDWSLDMYICRMVGTKIGFYTGVGYISDSYMAGKYDYRPKRGFWTRSIAPDRTIAKCRILDFPVGIQYHLTGTDQSGIVLSAGVTTQYMVREVYYYKYEYEEPDLVMNWMGNGENFHWFSGAQFSVEYRIKVGRGVSIGMNPYFNLPLKGIGHGHIKISTMGFRTGIIF